MIENEELRVLFESSDFVNFDKPTEVSMSR